MPKDKKTLIIAGVVALVLVVGGILLLNRPTFSSDRCWSSVISAADLGSSSTLFWPNGCKGAKPTATQVCTEMLTALTADEIKEYEAWVSAGKPTIPGCTLTNSSDTDTDNNTSGSNGSGSIVAEFTRAQVASANTISNCLMIRETSVYRIPSTYPSEHPGGAEFIVSNCGKDATEAFNQAHDDGRAVRELAPFFVGTLKD